MALEAPPDAGHHLMAIGVDVEPVAVGDVLGLEVDLALSIVGVAILDFGEGVAAELLLDARAHAPAVCIQVLIVVRRSISADEIEPGVRVAALGIDKSARGCLEPGARDNVDVATRVPSPRTELAL